jgi:hypothetical protein
MGDGSYGTILVLNAHMISELVNAHNFYVF